MLQYNPNHAHLKVVIIPQRKAQSSDVSVCKTFHFQNVSRPNENLRASVSKFNHFEKHVGEFPRLMNN